MNENTYIRDNLSQYSQIQESNDIYQDFKNIENESCKLHLAECYNLTKKNETLNKALNEKDRQIEYLEKQIEDLVESQKLLEESYKNNLLKQENIILKLSDENKTLTINHPYSDLLDYYEKQITCIQNSCELRVKEYLSLICSFNVDKHNYSNRESIYKKALKKQEKDIENFKHQLDTHEKNQRAVNSKQIFFSKYIKEAESKITELNNKLKKKEILIKDHENKLNELELKQNKVEEKTVLNTNNITINNNFNTSPLDEKLSNEATSNVEFKDNNINDPSKLNKRKDNFFNLRERLLSNNTSSQKSFKQLIDSFSEIKSFMLKQKQELLKVEDEFKLNNYKCNHDFDKTNIMKLLFTIRELIIKNSENLDKKMEIEVIESMFNNIKSYIIFVLKSFEKMTLNQYELINLTCELKEKLGLAVKQHISEDINNFKIPKNIINAYFNDLRNICNIMLFDFNPKKLDFLLKSDNK